MDIQELLEIIEDHDSVFWERERSDIDGTINIVINIKAAIDLIQQYAESYRADKCYECR